jgi:hypothetical protein
MKKRDILILILGFLGAVAVGYYYAGLLLQ